MSKSIGQLIKEKRVSKRLKQLELADKADISRNFLSEIENEKTEPGIRSLRRISNALNVSLAELFEESNYQRVGENKTK